MDLILGIVMLVTAIGCFFLGFFIGRDLYK